MTDSFWFLTPAAAGRLGQVLRTGRTDELRRRRAVIALSLVSAGVMGVTAVYQTGLIRHMPGPRAKPFDADRVNGSPQAYQVGSTPDAVLGLVSYAVTAALAAAGGDERPAALDVALGVKSGLDAAAACKLALDQATKLKAYSAFGLLATACTLAALPFTLPAAWRAAVRSRGR